MLVEKLTTESFISARRRGPAVPNYDGTLALYTESEYRDEKTLTEFHVLNIATGVSRCVVRDDQAYEPVWLGDGINTILYLTKGDLGMPFLISQDLDDPTDMSIIYRFSGPVHGLKTKALADGTLILAVMGYVGPNGELFNPNDGVLHTGKIYTSSLLQLDDLQSEPHTYTVWYSTLKKEDRYWGLTGTLKNVFGGTSLHIPHTPTCFGKAKSKYDIGEYGIIASATSERCGPAWGDTASIYFTRVHSFETGEVDAPKKIPTLSNEQPRKSVSPQFNHDGTMLAFLFKKGPNYEKAQVYIYHTLHSGHAFSSEDMVTGVPSPLVPTSFRFSADGHSLYVTAEECGQLGLYHVKLQPHAHPLLLTHKGSVSDFYPVKKSATGDILVTSSSFVESCLYQVVSLDPVFRCMTLSSLTDNGAKLGLSSSQISDFYFEGGGDYAVHAWAIFPRDFDENKKYPLAMLVHDTVPPNSWLNSWNMKWNPALWAAQGYVCVLPNLTGSTGYGRKFSKAIKHDWIGRPFHDLIGCMDSLRGIPGIDVENAVIAGAGYGGYLINWVQGHPGEIPFKAMVCHGGVHSTRAVSLTSNHIDFNGPFPELVEDMKEIELRNPAQRRLARSWQVPMLVIHNEKDPIVPVTEGLAMYNNLRSLGIPSKFITFKDEGHDVLKPENSLEWHRQVFAWINKYTGAGAEQAGVKKGGVEKADTEQADAEQQAGTEQSGAEESGAEQASTEQQAGAEQYGAKLSEAEQFGAEQSSAANDAATSTT
ncbi:prolyl oligopeptidase [Nemania sp. FL0916]|nr:prolyl oligopeptidase [Nemania sp. FL0916]